MQEHHHFDIDAAVAAVRATFAEARKIPNPGQTPDEILAIDWQKQAEDLRCAFAAFYFGMINAGLSHELQAHIVGVALADCAADWLTGYDLSRGVGPANAVIQALMIQLKSIIYTDLEGGQADAETSIRPVSSGRA